MHEFVYSNNVKIIVYVHISAFHTKKDALRGLIVEQCRTIETAGMVGNGWFDYKEGVALSLRLC